MTRPSEDDDEGMRKTAQERAAVELRRVLEIAESAQRAVPLRSPESAAGILPLAYAIYLSELSAVRLAEVARRARAAGVPPFPGVLFPGCASVQVSSEAEAKPAAIPHPYVGDGCADPGSRPCGRCGRPASDLVHDPELVSVELGSGT